MSKLLKIILLYVVCTDNHSKLILLKNNICKSADSGAKMLLFEKHQGSTFPNMHYLPQRGTLSSASWLYSISLFQVEVLLSDTVKLDNEKLKRNNKIFKNTIRLVHMD